MRVLLISSVAPKPDQDHPGGSELALYRHLIGEPEIELGLVTASAWPGPQPALRAAPTPLSHWLRSNRFGPWVEFAQTHLTCFFDYRPIRKFGLEFKPDVVLTVARCHLWESALRFARESGVPLVSVFHSWWPDEQPRGTVWMEDIRFRRLYARSRVAFCISEALRGELGRHQDSVVLPPITGGRLFSSGAVTADRFDVVFLGALRLAYRDRIGALAGALESHPRLRLRVFGPVPGGSRGCTDPLLRRTDIYRGAPPDGDPGLESALARAGALLTCVSFDPRQERRVRTYFPSKLAYYCRLGRPLVLWAPPSSPAAEWMRARGAGILVDRNDPGAVVAALEALASDPDRCRKLGARASELAATEFDPAPIRRIFLDGLARAAGSDGKVAHPAGVEPATF